MPLISKWKKVFEEKINILKGNLETELLHLNRRFFKFLETASMDIKTGRDGCESISNFGLKIVSITHDTQNAIRSCGRFGQA